jgi:uncharacterized membrane protein YdjX (TVP38/TMEM64 family)
MDFEPLAPRRWRFALWRAFALSVLVVLFLVIYWSGVLDYLSWESLQARRDSWRAIIDQHRAETALLFLVVSIALMSLSLPVGSMLSIAAGALFDLWLGIGLIIVASLGGASLSFLASRYLFRDFVRYWLRRWVTLVDRGIERDGVRYLLMLRLSPVVPFFAVNAAMGLTSMKFRPYLLATLVGILPSCFLYVMVGTQIRRINSPQDIVSWELLTLLTILALTPWLLHRLARPSPHRLDAVTLSAPALTREETPP